MLIWRGTVPATEAEMTIQNYIAGIDTLNTEVLEVLADLAKQHSIHADGETFETFVIEHVYAEAAAPDSDLFDIRAWDTFMEDTVGPYEVWNLRARLEEVEQTANEDGTFTVTYHFGAEALYNAKAARLCRYGF